MKGEDLVKKYGKMLTQFERDEVLDNPDLIHYINMNSKYKGQGGKYVRNALNYLEENPEKN